MLIVLFTFSYMFQKDLLTHCSLSFIVEEEDVSSQFRLSVSQLPGWAQKQVISRPSIAKGISAGALERATGQSKAPAPVGGRWAQVRDYAWCTLNFELQTEAVATNFYFILHSVSQQVFTLPRKMKKVLERFIHPLRVVSAPDPFPQLCLRDSLAKH